MHIKAKNSLVNVLTREFIIKVLKPTIHKYKEQTLHILQERHEQ